MHVIFKNVDSNVNQSAPLGRSYGYLFIFDTGNVFQVNIILVLWLGFSYYHMFCPLNSVCPSMHFIKWQLKIARKSRKLSIPLLKDLFSSIVKWIYYKLVIWFIIIQRCFEKFSIDFSIGTSKFYCPLQSK